MFSIRSMNIWTVCFISTVVSAADYNNQTFFEHYAHSVDTLVQVGTTAVERQNIPNDNQCLATYKAEAARLHTLPIPEPLLDQQTREKVDSLFSAVSEDQDYQKAHTTFIKNLNYPGRLSTWAAWNFQQTGSNLVFSFAQKHGVIPPKSASNDLDLITANTTITQEAARYLIPVTVCLSMIACTIRKAQVGAEKQNLSDKNLLK